MSFIRRSLHSGIRQPQHRCTLPTTTTSCISTRLRSFSMSTPSSQRQPALTADNINPAVIKVEYAVRGELALKADKYMQQLSSGEGSDLPFKKVVTANIGNPQQKGLDQQPITYWRQVISLLEYPDLMQGDLLEMAKKIYPEDVLDRAKGLWEEIGSVGAYSPSKGVLGIRKRVAKFLEGESLNLPIGSLVFLSLPLGRVSYALSSIAIGQRYGLWYRPDHKAWPGLPCPTQRLLKATSYISPRFACADVQNVMATPQTPNQST
jgi:hypothetical protein